MPPPPPLMMILDTDRDGELSEDEISMAAEALAKLDTNGDGKLDHHELRPPMPPPGADGEQGPPPPPGKGPRPEHRDGEKPKKGAEGETKDF